MLWDLSASGQPIGRTIVRQLLMGRAEAIRGNTCHICEAESHHVDDRCTLAVAPPDSVTPSVKAAGAVVSDTNTAAGVRF